LRKLHGKSDLGVANEKGLFQMRGLLEIAIRLPTRKAGIFPHLCDGIRQMIESLQQFARVIEAHGPLRIAGTAHVPSEYNHMRHIASTSLRTSSGTLIRAQNRSYLLRPWSNASVLVHFRGFREASVQQFVQQPRGAAGFQVLLTTDKNIQYQQNLAGRKISVLVLANSQWPVVRLHLGSIATAVNAAKPGGYTEVEIPKR